MKYKVLASLRDEMNQGWVWSTNSSFNVRSIVKIINLENKKSIHCEHLQIEDNYINTYNDNHKRYKIKKDNKTIIVNAWYRDKLGNIETKKYHNLELKAASSLWGKFQANINHPQVVVRMATWLSIISVLLGIIGVCLGLKST